MLPKPLRLNGDSCLIKGHGYGKVHDAEIWVLQEVFHIMGSVHDGGITVAVPICSCARTEDDGTRYFWEVGDRFSCLDNSRQSAVHEDIANNAQVEHSKPYMYPHVQLLSP